MNKELLAKIFWYTGIPYVSMLFFATAVFPIPVAMPIVVIVDFGINKHEWLLVISYFFMVGLGIFSIYLDDKYALMG